VDLQVEEEKAMIARPVPGTDGVVAVKSRIAGTRLVDYSAWKQGTWCEYSTMAYEHWWPGATTGLWGRLGTEWYPDSLRMLNGEERAEAVRTWYRSCAERAYDAICAAFPEAAAFDRRDGGRILGEEEEEKAP
jgi:hypothetical protein